eukprot:TRINITY_DN1775_c0_g4_i1.p1 TRINITY_DN1775_c0_g4~~TRINITY_DN1775_c0_g4_i1.p1  ORF type:complete len:114 (+),score=15.07 TRINITY_DN1775_c0_g4_i1:108-449(+)
MEDALFRNPPLNLNLQVQLNHSNQFFRGVHYYYYYLKESKVTVSLTFFKCQYQKIIQKLDNPQVISFQRERERKKERKSIKGLTTRRVLSLFSDRSVRRGPERRRFWFPRTLR